MQQNYQMIINTQGSDKMNEAQKTIGNAIDLINDMEKLLKEMDVPIEKGYIITQERLTEVQSDLLGLWEALN